MKRWIGAFIAVVLSCVPIFLARSTNPSLLLDSDTGVLLQTIRQKNAPFSWFLGDWPLYNHFYRPIPTLAFELDNRLYGTNAAGYGLTNDLLCIACVLLLFWFLRELTDRPALAAGAAVLFALQHVGYQSWLVAPVMYLAILTAILGFARHRFKIRYWVPAVLVLYYSVVEIVGMDSGVGIKTVGWLPGRTATVMTVFALFAMAAYTRYERLSADRPDPSPTPMDPPATRNTESRPKPKGTVVVWAVLSVIAVALALASYEQAVMVPAALLAVAVTMRMNRYRVRWGWQAAFWLMLVGYLVLRKMIIPPGASGYQLQQFRSGAGVRISLLDYILPFANGIPSFITDLDGGLLSLVGASPYLFVLSAVSNLTAFFQARRRWIFALAGYGMSIIAYLPMAWLHQFGHYHYWPMALRSLFAATLLWIAFDLAVNAWSPPTRQAPLRLDPAPGSLLHR